MGVGIWCKRIYNLFISLAPCCINWILTSWNARIYTFMVIVNVFSYSWICHKHVISLFYFADPRWLSNKYLRLQGRFVHLCNTVTQEFWNTNGLSCIHLKYFQSRGWRYIFCWTGSWMAICIRYSLQLVFRVILGYLCPSGITFGDRDMIN